MACHNHTFAERDDCYCAGGWRDNPGYDLDAYHHDHIAARAKLNEAMAQATRDYIAAMKPLALEEYMFQRFIRGIWDDYTAIREVGEHVDRLADEAKLTIYNTLALDAVAYARHLKGE